MRKLKLDLDAIQVDSFDVKTSPSTDRGTVHGAATTTGPFHPATGDETTGTGGSGDIFCISQSPCVPSNEPTCGAMTCADTCWPTCYC